MTKKSYALANKWSIAAAVALSAALSGCDGNPAPGTARGSGSVAMSQDSALVYAADSDNGQLIAVDPKKGEIVAKVNVGVHPYRIAVGKDDTIYVANRGSRSVSVIRRGEWSVGGELATDVDPVGLGVSADGNKIFVASGTAADTSDYSTLAQFDAKSLQRDWTMKLPDEPRALAVIDAHTVAVGLYRAGDVVMIDVDYQKIEQSKTELYERANATALSTQAAGSNPYSTSAATFHPRALTDLAVSPDGKRVFATTLLSREAAILTQPTPATPYYESQGPKLAGSVATPAVATFDVNGATLSPKVDDLNGYGYGGISYDSSNSTTGEPNYPQTSFATVGYDPNETLVQGPTALVVDSLGDWVYVVNRDSRNVMILNANTRTARPTAQAANDYSKISSYGSELPSVYASADIGAGADGIAVAGDNKSFFIYSQFDHQLAQYQLSGDHQSLETKQVFTLGQDTLSADLAQGRRSFYDATDRRISARSAAISCGSCHLEGREDAHVWNFPDGPRQTPSLAGRGLLETQPYHWSGEFPTLTDFLNHTVTSRMGGTGIDEGSADKLDQYIASLPTPENPNVLAAMTDAQLRGEAVFNQAGCGTCHSGKWLTNDTNVDVGTLTPTDTGLVVQNGLNVPSLRGIARTAPYLHDGSVATLELRLRNNPGDKHGITSTLTDGQISDLVAYLKTL
ncbi:MAG: c-type cytochrome [Myxococcaceae bacterium]